MTDVSFTRHAGGSLIVTIDGVDHLAPVPAASYDDAGLIHVQPHPNPSRITAALDMRGLWGPEVDEALGVEEPAVDEWEAGTRLPTPGEIARLATLTGYHPAWFYGDDLPPITTGWVCQRSGKGRGCYPIVNGKVIEPESRRPSTRTTDKPPSAREQVDAIKRTHGLR